MSQNEPTILDARPEMLAEIGRMMGRAFRDDPMSTHVFPAEAGRIESMAWMMQRAVRYGMAYGEVRAAEDASAAIVWLPPGKKMTLWRMFRAGMFGVPLRFGWKAFRGFLAFGRTAERLHEKAVSGRHWYLFILAVDPSRQGQGLGAAMLKSGLARADRDGLPVYLETAVESNVAFYGKYGFEPVDRAAVPGANAQLWAMVRPPRPGTKEA